MRSGVADLRAQTPHKFRVVLEAGDPRRAPPQFRGSCPGSGAQFQYVIAQLAVRNDKRQNLPPRHPPPESRAAEPILKRVHRESDYLRRPSLWQKGPEFAEGG